MTTMTQKQMDEIAQFCRDDPQRAGYTANTYPGMVRDLLSHIAFLTDPVDGAQIEDELEWLDTLAKADVKSFAGAAILIRRLQSTINQQRAERREGSAFDAALGELRAHWDDFTDCDWFPTREGFEDRMEAAGFALLRAVTSRDLEEEPFPAERGIEKGGMLWALTDAGRAALIENEKERT